MASQHPDIEKGLFTQEEIDKFAAYCAGNSGVAGGSEALRDSARSALKQVIEAGTAPETAAKDITE